MPRADESLRAPIAWFRPTSLSAPLQGKEEIQPGRCELRPYASEQWFPNRCRSRASAPGRSHLRKLVQGQPLGCFGRARGHPAPATSPKAPLDEVPGRLTSWRHAADMNPVLLPHICRPIILRGGVAPELLLCSGKILKEILPSRTRDATPDLHLFHRSPVDWWRGGKSVWTVLPNPKIAMSGRTSGSDPTRRAHYYLLDPFGLGGRPPTTPDPAFRRCPAPASPSVRRSTSPPVSDCLVAYRTVAPSAGTMKSQRFQRSRAPEPRNRCVFNDPARWNQEIAAILTIPPAGTSKTQRFQRSSAPEPRKRSDYDDPARRNQENAAISTIRRGAASSEPLERLAAAPERD